MPVETARAAWAASSCLALLLIAGCSALPPGRDAVAAERDGLAAADRAAYESTISRLEAENRALNERLREARDRTDAAATAGGPDAELRERLAQCSERLQDYQAGLERAVAELNDQRRSATTAALQQVAAARPSPSGQIHSRWGPHVQIVGTDIQVTGELWSYRDAATDVQLQLELLEDSQPITETSMPLHVPANTDQTYAHTFHHTPRNGVIYSARVDLDY